MNVLRTLKHLCYGPWRLRRTLPKSALKAIERAIRDSEQSHTGEIRFAVEAHLDLLRLLKGQSARARALEVFSRLRVWDTEHNNGVLIYLLLADRRVEIIADRGIHRVVGTKAWQTICRDMEAAFRQGHFEKGVVEGIKAVTTHLTREFPGTATDQNELPDESEVL